MVRDVFAAKGGALTNPLQALANAAADWARNPLSADVEWATRRAILDWFATMLPGCTRPPATRLLVALASERPAGAAICYVDGGSCAPRYAALLNAVASHTVEFDDIFRDGGYHPGSSTVAAALALVQHRSGTLDDLHRAVVAGYEVGCRISLAIQPSHYDYWHTTATVGTFGAAVAGAVLLGCDANGIGHSIALASSFAGGHQQNLQGGGMAKALHPGHAADAGLMAAYAAAGGLTGSIGSLDAVNGFAAATSRSRGDWASALEGLGDWTPITRMTVKAHGCCGHIFPALDGLMALREKTPFKSEDVVTIQVEGYGATRSMCDRPYADSEQEARFSIQFCLAAQLVLGGVRLDAFTPDALNNPRIRALMPKITVTEDADFTAAYPRRRQARLRVALADGSRLEFYQAVRKGDPEAPLSDAELCAKFDELAGSVAKPGDVAALRDTILYGNIVPGRIPLSAHTV